MSAGDNIRNDRWRPGYASSERRAREELAAADEERRVFSRELSFVPVHRAPKFEAHDAPTVARLHLTGQSSRRAHAHAGGAKRACS
jgi:hypothetical protein